MEQAQVYSENKFCKERCKSCGLPSDECRCGLVNESWSGLIPAAVSFLFLITLTAADHISFGWFGLSWLRASAYAVSFIPVGWPVIRKAVGEMREGEIANEYFLMSLASLGAFAIGEYPEAVAVMLFYCIGEYFQDRAVDHAQRDIRSLVNLTPEKCLVIEGGNCVDKLCDEVIPGEIIEIVAGGRVPLDGELLD